MRRMYSLAQIQAIVALMASKGELDFSNVDLKVKTIEQSEANALVNFDINNPTDTNIEVTNVYSRFEKINRVCYIVFNIKIKNNGESESTSFNYQISDISVPKEIGDFIYDFGGKKISESPVSGNLSLISFDGFSSSSSYPDVMSQRGVFILQHTSANTIRVTFNSIPTIQSNAEIKLTGRALLTLI